MSENADRLIALFRASGLPAKDLRAAILSAPRETVNRSWYCDQCHVEVYERRCPHCGKTEREPA